MRFRMPLAPPTFSRAHAVLQLPTLSARDPGRDEAFIAAVSARVAVKLRDTYFLTMTVSNYESRIFERPILPGMNVLQVRAWEGRLDDFGVQLMIDINNNLEIRTQEQTPVVTEEGLGAVMRLL